MAHASRHRIASPPEKFLLRVAWPIPVSEAIRRASASSADAGFAGDIHAGLG
jgi:hypothetical protein